MSTALLASVRVHQQRGEFATCVLLLSRCIDTQRAARSKARRTSSQRSSSLTVASSASVGPKPLLFTLLARRAFCYSRLHEWNACARDCDEILTRSPTDVTANSLRVECILGLKRYDEAEQRINALVAQTHSASAAPYAPLQRLWKQIQEERQGRFDVAAMSDECISLVTPRRDGLPFDKLRVRRHFPCIRLGPHADYLHPSVECGVTIVGKGRGTRVRSLSSHSSSSSSSSSSSTGTGVRAASASSSSSPPGTLPRHTLVMSMKALSVHLRCDDLSEEDTLLRKLRDQKGLTEQVQRLFSTPAQESQRAKLLRQLGATDVWEAGSGCPTSWTAKSLRAAQARLALALPHNSFGDALSSMWREAGVGGTALFFLPSLLNHSCVPNCTWQLLGDQIFIRTVREVKPGAELTLAYMPTVDSSTPERRAYIHGVWEFPCSCTLCAAWSENPEIAKREAAFTAACAVHATQFKAQQSAFDRLAVFHASKPALAKCRLEEQIKTVRRMQAAIAAHTRFLAARTRASALRVVLLQPLEQLTRMLESLLRVLPQSHSSFGALLSLHLRSCESRIDLTRACASHDRSLWPSGALDALHLQLAYPAHATLSASQQQAMLTSMIEEHMAMRGDTDVKMFGRSYGPTMAEWGLQKLFDQCCSQRTQLQPDK